MNEWLKPAHAAKYCDVTTKTFRGWLKDGLKFSRLKSGHILIKKTNIDEYLQGFEVAENEVDQTVNRIINSL